MGRRKRDGEFWDSATKNNASYLMYYDRLKELAISMFEYKNLPDTVDQRFLELVLFEQGQAVFFKDEVMGYLTLRNARGGQFDVYGIPTKRRAYAANGYQNGDLDESNSVIIWNNYLHSCSAPIIRNYAERLWEIDRIIDVNARAQKTPVLIMCDENQRMSLENFYKQYAGNMPMIAADKSLDLNNFKVLNTEAPYVCDNIYKLKTQYWNEALTYLGISNLNIQKKERLVADEVVRAMGGTIASRYSRLEARREAIAKINKMFGLEIECNYREDYREADDEVMFSGDTGDGAADIMQTDIRTR